MEVCLSPRVIDTSIDIEFMKFSGNGLVSYYIDSVLTSVGVTNPGIKSEINGGLQIWNLLCAFTAALLVDKLGRRTLFIISNAGMLIGDYFPPCNTFITNSGHDSFLHVDIDHGTFPDRR